MGLEQQATPINTQFCEVQMKEQIRAQFVSVPLRVGPVIVTPIECPTNCPGPVEHTVEYRRVFGVLGKVVPRTEVSCFITGRSIIRSWLDETLIPSPQEH
jgi:hypothetical protein